MYACYELVRRVVAAARGGTVTRPAPATRPPPTRATVVVMEGRGGGAARVISGCHFRKTATEYDRKNWYKVVELY
jgi:hypothetical protein